MSFCSCYLYLALNSLQSALFGQEIYDSVGVPSELSSEAWSVSQKTPKTLNSLRARPTGHMALETARRTSGDPFFVDVMYMEFQFDTLAMSMATSQVVQQMFGGSGTGSSRNCAELGQPSWACIKTRCS
eukprot:4265189-Amphidinium_carterae.1